MQTMSKKILAFSAILLLGFSFILGSNKIDHLKSFAKAYGYVKYFHPSDEAESIDWKSFAAYGANEIIKCENRKEVVATLNRIFQPMAPGVQFTESKGGYDLGKITPNDKENYELTYWQHKGVSTGMNHRDRPYTSVRVNRYVEVTEEAGFGNLISSISPKLYKGKEIKYTGWVKMKTGSKGTGHLWLRIDKPNKKMGFFDNMGANPITKDGWEQYEIVGSVDEDASNIVFGCFLSGQGTLYLDDVHMYYKEGEEWIEIPIENSDFEAEDLGEKSDIPSWVGRGKGYAVETSNSEVKEGKKGVVIAYKGKSDKIHSKPIFDAAPSFGDLIEKEIGDGIFCQIPLCLYGNKEATYPKSKSLSTLVSSLEKTSAKPTDLSVRLGNVINTYNVFQHFYPYHKEVGTNWDDELVKALKRSMDDQTAQDHLITLEKLTAPLKDGHVHVRSESSAGFLPPITWEWIEDKLVITSVLAEGIDVQVGDVVDEIDGQSSKAYFDEINTRISAGTKGWLNYMAHRKSLMGEKGQDLVLGINGKKVTVNRDGVYGYGKTTIPIQENAYKELDNNIYYLNLSAIEMDAITDMMPQLEAANGIICDLRGYPNGNHGFIAHLLAEKDTSTAWMNVPYIIYPDQENLVGYDPLGWGIEPASPYLGDKNLVFIIDGSAISYAESYMSFIEGYKLATIVGQPTAGANGNVNPFSLLGNYSISWTGMKVVKHDGSQHHGVGIQPNVFVEKTIEGVKSERDEFLEKAIEVVMED